MNEQPKRLVLQALRQAQMSRQQHFAWIPETDSLEDVLRQSYWSRIVEPFVSPGDTIEFVRADHAFEGSLRVVAATRSGIAFQVRFLADQDGPISVPDNAGEPIALDSNSRITVEFRRGHGWRVMDNGNIAEMDGKKLIKLGSEGNALKVAEQYRATLHEAA